MIAVVYYIVEYGERLETALLGFQDVIMPGTWTTTAGCIIPIIPVNYLWFSPEQLSSIR